MRMNEAIQKGLQEIEQVFSKKMEGILPEYIVKERPDGDYLIFMVAKPSQRLYEALDYVNRALDVSNLFKDRISLSTRLKKPSNLLEIPEIALLQHELSSSLTVDKNTFGDDFLLRYIPSVTRLEPQILVHANHVVYGRRGSGKSSLLSYAKHNLRLKDLPFCWIAMQTYVSRADKHAIASVLSEIFYQSKDFVSSDLVAEFEEMSQILLSLGESDDSESAIESKINKLTPRMRKMLANGPASQKSFTIFLDDLHVLAEHLQPELLANIYAISRGNKVYIKLSGIEQLTKLWDSVRGKGMESPHDIQTLLLDHNLTSPDQSKDHIVSILDKHATYCGLPDIRYVASEEFLNRLALSAAAVPRDALSLFSKSITRSKLKKQKSVSITSLNAAASEAVEEKLKDIKKDVATGQDEISICLNRVKKFCLNEQKKNAFLVKIVNGQKEYSEIQKLIALRFIHVLHEGITPHQAGKRYVALMLDYGFYIGIRTARSMNLFPDRPRQLLAKELRTLPILSNSKRS